MKKVLMAVVVCLSMMTVGCASVVWNAAFREDTLISDATAMMEGIGAKEVGKYTVFGQYAIGYSTYAGLVSAELRKGKRSYHYVVKNYYIFQQVVGYIEVLSE